MTQMATNAANLESGNYDFTPFYMAKVAEELFQLGSNIEIEPGIKVAPGRIFVLCNCIEIGLKAHLLNDNNTPNQNRKNKKISHNLVQLAAAAGKLIDVPFSESDEYQIALANKFYLGKEKQKDLQYCSVELITEFANDRKNIVEVDKLLLVAEKVVTSIRKNRFFSSSDTSKSNDPTISGQL